MDENTSSWQTTDDFTKKMWIFVKPKRWTKMRQIDEKMLTFCVARDNEQVNVPTLLQRPSFKMQKSTKSKNGVNVFDERFDEKNSW